MKLVGKKASAQRLRGAHLEQKGAKSSRRCCPGAQRSAPSRATCQVALLLQRSWVRFGFFGPKHQHLVQLISPACPPSASRCFPCERFLTLHLPLSGEPEVHPSPLPPAGFLLPRPLGEPKWFSRYTSVSRLNVNKQSGRGAQQGTAGLLSSSLAVHGGLVQEQRVLAGTG